MSRPIRDIVAEAIRGDGIDMCDSPWTQLNDDRRRGWLGDADRAIAAIGQELGDLLRVAEAARAFVDGLPMNNVGDRYVYINNGSDLDALVHHTINLTEASTARVVDALTQSEATP